VPDSLCLLPAQGAGPFAQDSFLFGGSAIDDYHYGPVLARTMATGGSIKDRGLRQEMSACRGARPFRALAMKSLVRPVSVLAMVRGHRGGRGRYQEATFARGRVRLCLAA
jgi:hypothetical protein